MQSLFLRNLFFTILQPGIVAGLVPYLITKHDLHHIFSSPFTVIQYIGIVLFGTGFTIMTHCIIRFAIYGKGTLSPADPTKKLVISGLYKYSRNPMYVGVMLMLIGEVLLTQNISLLIYSGGIFTAFCVFVVFWEEPRLGRDFGDEYAEYRKRVRRWV